MGRGRVAGWLYAQRLGQYAEAFSENHIDAEILKNITADDLQLTKAVRDGVIPRSHACNQERAGPVCRHDTGRALAPLAS